MGQPLVSICIPTYNRAEYLRRSLESLVVQPEFLNGRVEIIISDNASMDSTPLCGEEYSQKYSNILYFRNKENIRDANFPLVMSKGTGKCLKLCNDTLIYTRDALRLFCNTVEQFDWSGNERPMLFFSNGAGRPKNLSGIFDFERFLYAISYWITWIGAFSCWKEDFDSLGEDLDSARLHLWQVRQICRILGGGKKAVIITEKFCTTQAVKNKDISYGLYQIFYTNYLSILKPFLDKKEHSQACYDFLRKDLLLNFFPSWIADWQLQNKHFNYSEEEDLKQKITEAYRNESYFKEYNRIYERVLLKKRLLRPLKFLKDLIQGG